MKSTRRLIVALTLSLALLFNIERLDFGTVNTIDISSFTYVVATAAVASILLFPRLTQRSTTQATLLWLSAYLVGKLFHKYPLIGDVYTYLTVTEVAFLLFVIQLTSQVNRHFNDFEEAVENITFADTTHRIQPLSSGTDAIQTELVRSRRYQAPLSLVLISPQPESIKVILHRTVQEVQQAMMSRYVLAGLARLVSNEIRRTDMLFEQRRRARLALVCTHTAPEDTQILIDRIRASASQHLGVTLDISVAGFPDEALTFEELLDQADQKLQTPKVGGIQAVQAIPLLHDGASAPAVVPEV
jgi:hypothetical protein